MKTIDQFIITALFCFTVTAFAKNTNPKTLKNNTPVCLTEENYIELLEAIANKDQNQLDYMFTKGCTITKPGVKITVLETPSRSFGQAIRMAKIRLYSGKTALEAWTAYDFVFNP